MSTVYASPALPPSERVPRWREAIDVTYGAVETRPLRGPAFVGELSAWALGDAVLTRISSSPMQYLRHRQADDSDHFFVAASLCAEAHVTQDDRCSSQRHGDLVLFDGARPYSCVFPQGDDQIVLAVPRQRLLSYLPDADALVSRTLAADSALGRLAGRMMVEAAGSGPLPLQAGERVCSSLLELVATAFDVGLNHPADYQPKHGRLQLQRVQRHVRAHLADPMLSLAAVALATHVSTRTLTRMFAREGTTFSRWLWQERLSACHDALLRKKFDSVTQAAVSFGFTNLSHFSRAFRLAYGMPPSQLVRPAPAGSKP